MDLTVLITIVGLVLANIGTMLGLFMWATTHAASDVKENRQLIEENRRETDKILLAMHQETKEFHGRLCQIEERKIKLLEMESSYKG